MQDSIFTKIVNGEIPCHKVYEDEKTLAFLDINPLFPGEVLVIPKLQIDHIDDLPEEDYQAVYVTVKNISKRVKDILGTKRAVIQVFGFDVPHAHVHVIPANSGSELIQAIAERSKQGKPVEPDHSALAEMARKLSF